MFHEFLNSFVLGLLTPLTAACVLPLYPSFLSYLTSQFDTDSEQREYALFGSIVAFGIIVFMLLFGVVFTLILQQSLAQIIGIVSPVAFGILTLASIPLILDRDISGLIPSFNAPSFNNPFLDAFGFGFFFGAIVLPCNPAFIATFLSRAFLFSSPVASLLHFFLFGLGIGFPLLVFSVASSRRHKQVIGIMNDYDSYINRATGLIMLAVSLYYLVIVFRVIPL